MQVAYNWHATVIRNWHVFYIFLEETNKQTNKTKTNHYSIIPFQMACLNFHYFVCRNDLVLEITWTTTYCLIFWQQLKFICFSLHNMLCLKTEMWFTALIWKSLKITVLSRVVYDHSVVTFKLLKRRWCCYSSSLSEFVYLVMAGRVSKNSLRSLKSPCPGCSPFWVMRM